MDLSTFHFANPQWLWTGIAIPLIWLLYFWVGKIQNPTHQLEKFIDSHLLPYLLIGQSAKKKSYWMPLLAWTVAWGSLTLALAGPRWDFHEIQTFSKDQSLVIVLDLSKSMNATDINPSRLARAKQKIEDIILQSKGVKIGLIAFAADPHMIVPLTEDTETIRYLLPTIDTDLVHIQGSKLSPALEMASTMLDAEPGSNKAIVVISDGGFEDASAIKVAKKLADRGVVIHAMGVGTKEGAPIQDHEGNMIKKNGIPVFSKLEKERFSEINKAGMGQYLETTYQAAAERVILDDLEKRAEAQVAIGKTNKVWEEHFYVLLIPLLPIFLLWFKKGRLFALFVLFMPMMSLDAFECDYFKNSEQLGKEAFDNGDYETAIETFQDPYRKGVCCYKAGNYAEAENLFRLSTRPETSIQSSYNLGNALAQQQKYEEAITAYEDVLEQQPEHTKAKENLELIKKLLEQQKQENSQSENSDSDDKNQQNQDDSQKKDSQGKDQSKNTPYNPKKEENKENDSSDSQSPEKNKEEDTQESNKSDQNPQEKEESPKEQNEAKDEHPNPVKPDSSEKNNETKSQEDHDADLWLNRISNDPKTFMRNKFYIESKRNGTTEGIDPW